MKIADVALAQYADVDKDGRFTLINAGFTRLTTNKLPLVVPSLYVFLKLMAGRQDRGINRIHIALSGAAGVLLKADGSLAVSDDGIADSSIPMSFQLQNVTFDTEGRFDFSVSINGDLEARQSFHVEQTVRQSL